MHYVTLLTTRQKRSSGLFWMNELLYGDAELQVFSVDFQNRYKKSIKLFFFLLSNIEKTVSC